jgi:hypothetical protein
MCILFIENVQDKGGPAVQTHQLHQKRQAGKQRCEEAGLRVHVFADLAPVKHLPVCPPTCLPVPRQPACMPDGSPTFVSGELQRVVGGALIKHGAVSQTGSIGHSALGTCAG